MFGCYLTLKLSDKSNDTLQNVYFANIKFAKTFSREILNEIRVFVRIQAGPSNLKKRVVPKFINNSK